MKRRMMWASVIALVISLVAADIGQAQQKGRQRGGDRGGRSRGGFGGFGRGGGSRGPISLIGIENVQKELDLSQPQIDAVTKLTEAYRGEQRSARGNFDFRALRDLPEEELRKKLEEFRNNREANEKIRQEAQKKLNAKYDPQVVELLDPPQADRLDQIVLQLKGMAALLENDISKTLGLSQDQKDKIASLNSEYDKQRGELFGGGRSRFGGGNRDRGKRGARGKRGDRGKRGGDRGGFGEVFARMNELGEKRDADVLTLLTADQKKMFDELKGKPIDQRSLLGGFGRRGGGERSRGERGGRGKRPAM